MSTWRETILDEFVPNVSNLTLVADPDDLLTEETLSLELRSRGFEVIEFGDPVEFRYAYESAYRSRLDADVVVVLRDDVSALECLPFDLLEKGRRLSFSLGKLFPKLSYPVIEELEKSLLDVLYNAQEISPPETQLGDNDTKDYILLNVFGVSPRLISHDVDLLRCLLKLHYSGTSLPEKLASRLVQLLLAQGNFADWPLSSIIPDASSFFAFLQERWPFYLESEVELSVEFEIASDEGLMFSGPRLLPFGHQDIRIYIDNLFVEGKLHPTPVKGEVSDLGTWVTSGVIEEDVSDHIGARISRLFELIQEGMPSADSRHSDWQQFAVKWAELSALVHCHGDPEQIASRVEMSQDVNDVFAQWLGDHYASLVNLPPAKPAMLHHVPRRMARDLEEGKEERVAVVVVDGLSLDQWTSVRDVIQGQLEDVRFHEQAVFAWVPTLTSVSRQAIFSGKAPLYFPTSINSTNSEGKLWRQFWEGYGLSRFDVAYRRGLGEGDADSLLDETCNPESTKALGLVVDMVDKIMHGMQLGARGMHNQIQQWCQSGFLAALISRLLEAGYGVWLTSDHGNVECIGKGRPSEGAIAETRGERVRVYPSSELRSRVAKDYPFSSEWEPVGIPQDYYPLMAMGNTAFVKEGSSMVGHGGTAIEEVIVPLVKIEKVTR